MKDVITFTIAFALVLLVSFVVQPQSSNAATLKCTYNPLSGKNYVFRENVHSPSFYWKGGAMSVQVTAQGLDGTDYYTVALLKNGVFTGFKTTTLTAPKGIWQTYWKLFKYSSKTYVPAGTYQVQFLDTAADNKRVKVSSFHVCGPNTP